MIDGKDTPKQESPTIMQPYEAGFSTNFSMVHPALGKQQFTFRGATCIDWRYVMKDIVAFVTYMREKGWEMDVPKVAPLQQESGVDSEFPLPVEPGTGGISWRTKGGVLDMYKGKLHLIIPPGSVEPEEIACPIHQGKVLKRRSNEKGAWISHKEGDGYCNGSFEHTS